LGKAPEGPKREANFVAVLLTLVPTIDTYGDTLAQKDASRVTPVGRGEVGSRGRGCQPRSRAAPGQNARPALRPVCGDKTPAALGRQGTDNTRPSVVPPQEARELELSGGVRSLPQVP
jgi:hypothetical protein